MGRIFFVSHDGSRHEAPLEPGRSLMQIATEHGIPGIDGDCGGQCACGTCHVIVEAPWIAATGSCGHGEDLMLGLSAERVASSRLACQIEVTPELDGLTVRLPEFQA